MTSVLLQRAGAVQADPPDQEVAGHYGDPLREQRLLAEQGGIVDRGNRGVLRVGGEDRLSWLHSLTSQHLSALPPWTATEGLVLSPHGHVEHHFVATDDGGATWLDVEPGTSGELRRYLESMRFLLRVQPDDVGDRFAVLSLVGPQICDALPVLAQLRVGAAAPVDDGVFVRRMPWPGVAAADLLVARDAVGEWVARVGLPPAGIAAYEALRVEARRPRLGKETDHRTIPHEVGWLDSAVHLDKGCYRGQETVARVHNLGRPPRRLVFLHLDGSQERLPAPGDPVEVAGRVVGFVGTAARHYTLGPIALALVKRNTDDDAPMTAGGVPASVERVVEA